MTRRAYRYVDAFAYRLLPLGALITVVAFILGAYAFLTLAQRSQENAKAVRLFCALEAQLGRDVRASDRFLLEHPEGFANVSAAVIRQSVEDDRETLRLMRAENLDC